MDDIVEFTSMQAVYPDFVISWRLSESMFYRTMDFCPGFPGLGFVLSVISISSLVMAGILIPVKKVN